MLFQVPQPLSAEYRGPVRLETESCSDQEERLSGGGAESEYEVGPGSRAGSLASLSRPVLVQVTARSAPAPHHCPAPVVQYAVECPAPRPLVAQYSLKSEMMRARVASAEDVRLEEEPGQPASSASYSTVV